MFTMRRLVPWLVVASCLALLLSACNRRGGGRRAPVDGTDSGTPPSDGAVETDGGVEGPACDDPDGTACDDENPCTTGDVCTGGVCSGEAMDCSELDGECDRGTCDPSTGSCVAMPIEEGGECDDGDPCTEGDVCRSGSCEPGGPTDCSFLDDGCNVGMCDELDGCIAVAVADFTSCDDGNACTTGDSCSSGICVGETRDCSHLDDECNSGECNPSTGSCESAPVADSTLCDDGDGCTAIDRCVSGVCTGMSETDCSHLDDDCNTGVCDSSLGSCVAEPVTDGTFCDDGDSCTVSDSCTAGVCGGTNTCCSTDDFRLSEVYGDSPDYIEIVNTGSCTLDTSGLQLRWYLGCDTSVQTYTLPSRSVAAGGVLRMVDQSTSDPDEIYLGRNICHTYYEEGWVALCNGTCSSTCSNYLDYMEMSGSSTSPVSTPSCASFTPSPLYMGGATSTQSATRTAYSGSGAAGLQSDWTRTTYSP